MKQLANKFSTIHFDGPLYFHFSSSLWVYHKGVGHLLKLFVGVSEKDVTVNNKGAATVATLNKYFNPLGPEITYKIYSTWDNCW